MGEMVNGNIACPRARQAQIALFVDGIPSDFFDPATGVAIRTEE